MLSLSPMASSWPFSCWLRFPSDSKAPGNPRGRCECARECARGCALFWSGVEVEVELVEFFFVRGVPQRRTWKFGERGFHLRGTRERDASQSIHKPGVEPWSCKPLAQARGVCQ